MLCVLNYTKIFVNAINLRNYFIYMKSILAFFLHMEVFRLFAYRRYCHGNDDI